VRVKWLAPATHFFVPQLVTKTQAGATQLSAAQPVTKTLAGATRLSAARLVTQEFPLEKELERLNERERVRSLAGMAGNERTKVPEKGHGRLPETMVAKKRQTEAGKASERTSATAQEMALADWELYAPAWAPALSPAAVRRRARRAEIMRQPVRWK
jgi:hypothetical protein